MALIVAMFATGIAAWPEMGVDAPVLMVFPLAAAWMLLVMRGLHARVEGTPVVKQRLLPALRAVPIALFAALHGVLVARALGVRLPLDRVAWAGTGVVFVVLAAVFPFLPRNPVVGIRTVHTVASERAWRSTHRVGAVTFAAHGVLVAIAGQVHVAAGLLALVVGALANLVFVSVWSRRAWAADPGREPV